MRVALIALQERTADEAGTLRGALRLAGKSLAQRQLEFALALGCERIACLTHGIGPEVLALQHRAERDGARFSTVSGARQLLGLVKAQDELLVLADGLLPAAGEAVDLLEGPAILTLPSASAVPAGFERIDLDRAWAGAMIVPGRIVERLAELPPDIDPLSALLRIALQFQVRLTRLPEAVLGERRWLMASEAGPLRALEPGWITRHLPRPDWHAPGPALARSLAARLGTKLVGRPMAAPGLIGGGLALTALGPVTAYFASVPAGFALAALGWFTALFGMTARLLGGENAGSRKSSQKIDSLAFLFMDLAFVATATTGLYGTRWDRLVLALLPVLAMRVLARRKLPRWSLLLQDRLLLGLGFALAAGFGALEPAIQTVSLALFGLTAFWPARDRG